MKDKKETEMTIGKNTKPPNMKSDTENTTGSDCPAATCSPSLRMDAYYYEFDPTGVETIDRILCAVASAGKAYHHTNNWTDEHGPRDNCEGNTPVEWIQNAANNAATKTNNNTQKYGKRNKKSSS